MAQTPLLDVKIVPCGLHYFHPHRFRSRAVIEFAQPISISPDMVEKYQMGGKAKREACGDLLEQIAQSLQSVTVNTPDYETLQVIQAARRLYNPPDIHLTMHETMELTRRFAKAYEKLKDDPGVVAFKKNVLEYNKQLSIFGLKDHQVMKTAVNTLYALQLFLFRFVKFGILMVMSLPGLLINLPIIVLTSKISRQKAQEALKASSVKIAGRDVLATWKLMVALVVTPILYTVYGMVGTFVLARYLNVSMAENHPIQTFFVFQMVLMNLSYSTIRFAESGVDIMISLSPLVLAIMPWYHETTSKLRKLRQFLEAEVINLTNELGPKVHSIFFIHRALSCYFTANI
jgi:glycerol-3-phosphate O-acyltransferase / dihydroxyacetone phosphate acyltransferase